MPTLLQRVATYIRARSLMSAGDRVAVAVSGGADSVGLLRLLLELREELGIVLSVVHLHHGIRGAEADADADFVAGLAHAYDLELHLKRENAPEYARQQKLSLEAAARALRYRVFGDLLAEKRADRIATAHTLEDQAETVLMKLLRGAGTRGLSGIFPEYRLAEGSIVRPLLETPREPLREYLRTLHQGWREDQSNADLSFTRNRVRSRVLPVLREDVNPAADFALAQIAEIARAEEEYWNEQIARLLAVITVSGEPVAQPSSAVLPTHGTANRVVSLDIGKLQQQPLAIQRRVLRAAGEQLGCALDFEHVHTILDLLAKRSVRGTGDKTVEIAEGWRARLLFQQLRIEQAANEEEPGQYEQVLQVPGEVRVSQLGIVVRARIFDDTHVDTHEDRGNGENAGYNRAHSIRLPSFNELVVRNWRPGDRFRPALHTSEKRVKELLYPMRLAAEEKRLWPVVAAGERIIWVRGIESPELRTTDGHRLCIDESTE